MGGVLLSVGLGSLLPVLGVLGSFLSDAGVLSLLAFDAVADFFSAGEETFGAFFAVQGEQGAVDF